MFDGLEYSFDDVASVYNPYLIMTVYPLQAVLELLGGFPISVDTDGFNNDVNSIKNGDDMLTLLIHLGYLSYNGEEGTVRIPNEEIRMEFSRAVREVKRKHTCVIEKIVAM